MSYVFVVLLPVRVAREGLSTTKKCLNDQRRTTYPLPYPKTAPSDNVLKPPSDNRV